MCDELTIFSYNESVYENILDVYLIKDITSPDNRITPVTLSGYNLKGYPIYKPLSVYQNHSIRTDSEPKKDVED